MMYSDQFTIVNLKLACIFVYNQLRAAVVYNTRERVYSFIINHAQL